MIVEDWRGHLAWMFEESERTGKFLAFDCYAGLGGWDSGLDAEGFLILGCEIEPKIAELNPYPMICADFTTLNPGDFKGFDLIVGSPPCRNFVTSLCNVFGHKWKKPPDPKGEGMKLIDAYLNFIEVANPNYWLMENVVGLKKYLELKPRCTAYLGPHMKRCLWGNFPSFLIPIDMNKESMYYPGNFCKPKDNTWLRSWNRARIPLPVARALGVAVKQALEANNQ